MNKIASYFKLHPKVKAALFALVLVTFAAFDQAYNSGASYLDAAKIAGGAALVWVFAYIKSAASNA